MSCCVFGCENDSEKHPDKHFHQLPSNKKTKELWLKRVNRKNFIPMQFTYVCSDHFLNTDYSKPNPETPPEFQKKRLKKGTVPSQNLKGTDEDERV